MRRGVLIGGTILGMVVLAWILSLLGAYDVMGDVDIQRASAHPSSAHLLGTDHLGRDVLWRMITASEAFVGPGILAAMVALLVGGLSGALAGWKGGIWGEAIRYFFTVLSSFPRFVVVLLVCSIYGSSVWTIATACAMAYTPAMVESVYTRVAWFRVADFVLAAEAHGVHSRRILFFHLLWVNCRHLIGRHLISLFAYLVLVESTLSYIGDFGVMEPAPSWGNMIAFEWGVWEGNPWATWCPIAAIWLVILGCALLVEGLREDLHA